MKHYNVVRTNEDGSVDVDEVNDYDIPDDAATINRLFVEYEQTIAELRRQLREQQTRPPRYTHRNGEKEEPSIEDYYWVEYEGNEGARVMAVLFWHDKWGFIPKLKVLAIYGPIPQPTTGD